MPNPKLAPVILLSPVENGYVAYDPVADRLHHLNPVAALLAELCDGSRSIDEIRGLVGPLLPEGQLGEIERWIDEALRNFRRRSSIPSPSGSNKATKSRPPTSA